MESPAAEVHQEYDPDCYLCPRNKQASGATNPPHNSTFVFPNDYAAVREDQPDETEQSVLQVYYVASK